MTKRQRRHSLLTTQFFRWRARRQGHWQRAVTAIQRVDTSQVYIPGPHVIDAQPMTSRTRLRIRDRQSGQEVVF